MIEV
ncbi:4419e83f-071e-4da4-8d88-11c02c60335c [Thermothielavioides terrestris]|jgi:hypothetical protein